MVDVIDPEESESTQQLRLRVHNIRVQLIRASRRLGFEHDNGLVKQVCGCGVCCIEQCVYGWKAGRGQKGKD